MEQHRAVAVWAPSVRLRSWLVEGATLALTGAFVLGVYVAVQIGLGILVGLGTKADPLLSIIATGLVAVSFQPLRHRVQGLTRRFFYGARPDPYLVLANFPTQVNGEELLPRMANLLASATGALWAGVWLRSGAHLVLGAEWPPRDVAPEKMLLVMEDRLPPQPAGVRCAEIRHQAELLGALMVETSPIDQLRPIEQRLLEDLAAESGLLLRNLRLDRELGKRLEQLNCQAM
jgi:GAF domain-containing protein